MKEMFLLIKYFTWNNYLGQSTWGNCLGASYLEDNYPGVIIRGTIIQTTIVRGQFFWRPFSGAIIWGGGNYPGAIILWGNCLRGNFPGGQLPGANFLGGRCPGVNCPGSNCLRDNCPGGNFLEPLHTYNHTINLI